MESSKEQEIFHLSKTSRWALGPLSFLLMGKSKGRHMICLCRHSWEEEVLLLSICGLAIDRDSWSAVCSGPLPPGKARYPLYRKAGGPWGWSGWYRKYCPHRDLIPQPSSWQQVAVLTKLSWLLFKGNGAIPRCKAAEA